MSIDSESDTSSESDVASTGSVEALSMNSESSAADEHMAQQNDISSIIKPSMSKNEISHAVDSLSDGIRYQLLTKHDVPSKRFTFSKVFDNGRNRAFRHGWPLGLCIVSLLMVALFAKNRHTLGVLVNRPFTKWVKVHKMPLINITKLQ